MDKKEAAEYKEFYDDAVKDKVITFDKIIANIKQNIPSYQNENFRTMISVGPGKIRLFQLIHSSGLRVYYIV